jgi:hypothetical protein
MRKQIEESTKAQKDEGMKAITNLTRYSIDAMLCKECRDGARTVSSSARKRINNIFDYVRGDSACTVSTTANDQTNHINHSSDIQFIIHNS